MATQLFQDTARMPDPPQLYRYRTKVLVGPWRKSRLQALADALRARQVRRDEADRRQLHWLVKGRIEERAAS
jgi:hypothetical protein